MDISNPITADYKVLTIGHSTSAAEEIQKLAPGAKVVKAFNTIFAELLPAESRKGRKVQVFIADDDEIAKLKGSVSSWVGAPLERWALLALRDPASFLIRKRAPAEASAF